MPGETDLETLLSSMRPSLAPGTFVFALLPPDQAIPAGVDPIMVFREAWGRTLILAEEDAAEADLKSAFRCRMITLDVHSSLDAVGFLATVTARLAAVGMAVNPVSAFHHDHLFVPADRADEALAVLKSLAAERRG